MAKVRARKGLALASEACLKILRLAQSRTLLWAHERGSDVPFEVSKVVHQTLQPRCPTAPRCPGEAATSPSKGGLWLDPHERPKGSCAYTFATRGECLRTRNQLALEAALFRPGELVLTRRLLEALSFRVTEESVDSTVAEPRVLDAHGPIGPRHQVRLLRSPSAGQIVLVRRLPAAAPRREPVMTVLPAGSNT
ncbi:MAG: hypothetical protein KF878_31975 [Planctomycetes bacterium]|nr:hypothetical protein [Planctomycetota bacterium]